MGVTVPIAKRLAVAILTGEFGAVDLASSSNSANNRTVKQFGLRQRPMHEWQRGFITVGSRDGHQHRRDWPSRGSAMNTRLRDYQ